MTPNVHPRDEMDPDMTNAPGEKIMPHHLNRPIGTFAKVENSYTLKHGGGRRSTHDTFADLAGYCHGAAKSSAPSGVM
jgi:hypothetical protein